ncbi:MAG: dihydropteroate synthase [Gammaproteobacteria bacterium]|nr:dihydropteroate synthase [Gammaproteobacteria bacterium]
MLMLKNLNRPAVMGILNVTPDSFSDGGDFFSPEKALDHARQMIEEGAAIIDVGGESTRPGAAIISVDEELARVIPVIESIRAESDIPVSIDTSKPEVMSAAVGVGASMINDVRALQEVGAAEMAAELQVPVCLMHMQGEPQTMQLEPQYDDVVLQVKDFLRQRIEHCITAGLPRELIVIDPGFGFGKTLAHNQALLRGLDQLLEFELPLLIGISRKSMIAYMLDLKVDERLYGSISLASIAVWQGASIIRAHDVAATLQAVQVSYICRTAGN